METMEQFKIILVSFYLILLLSTSSTCQQSKNNFNLVISAGTKLNGSLSQPGTLGAGASIIYDKSHFFTSLNTRFQFGRCESFSEFVWAIGPLFTREKFSVRPYIGPALLFYKAKQPTNEGTCYNFGQEAFNTFSISMGLDLDINVTQRLGLHLGLNKNYNIDLRLVQVMVGVVYKFKKREPNINFALENYRLREVANRLSIHKS